jgi:type III pantothenate kinase
MLLCDIGNTSYHFLDQEKDYKESVKTFQPNSITQTLYYICVNPNVKPSLISLENWIDVADFIDITKYYSTMGIDRMVACEAIEDGLVIDAGSAITVDVIENGIFQGGFIYPGVQAMQQTYKNISSALDYTFNFHLDLEKLPKNSQDAISYGYLKTLHSEVYRHNKKIYLTGGDAQFLKHIFPDAVINTNLLFDGMKKILQRGV